MSAFYRFLFSTFLLLALGCFWASSAFALGEAGGSTTTKYYQDLYANSCSKEKTGFCSAKFATYIDVPARKYTQTGCELSTIYPTDHVLLKYRQENYYFSNGEYFLQSTANGSDPVAKEFSKTCTAPAVFKLTGCTATCEIPPPDPCDSLKGQTFSGAAQCGSFSCPNGGVMQNGSCTNGQGIATYGQPSGVLVDPSNNCIGSYQSVGVNHYYKKADEGKSSGASYCSATYTYNGSSGSSENVELANLNFYEAVPLPADGVCPPSKPLQSTINGNPVCIDNKQPDDSPCPVAGEKPNSNGVCVGSDDPTYPDDDTDSTNSDSETTCPAGQIRNNSGVCVPYADATKCPVGQVRDNLGTCSNDPKANSCPVGQVKNVTTGLCSNDPRGTGCAGGALPDKSGMCPDGKASCPIGKTRDSSGMCVGNNSNDPPDGTGCKDGSTADALGKCADGSGVCPSGQIRNSLGKCVVDDVNTPKSSTASNDCLVSPECSGDIVQCGLMQQNWQSGCDLQKALTGIPEGGGSQYAEVGANTNDSRVTAALGALTGYSNDIKGFLLPASSGSCPADFTVSVMNRTITVPLSKACPLFQLMRFLLHLIVNLMCLKILYSSFVRV